MHSYRVAGLGVASEIDLPGLIVRAAGEGAPDVTIRLGAVPASLDGAGIVRPTFEIAGDLFLLRIRGIARFLLRAGREMTVEPEAGTAPADVAIFITGTVFGILLHQRDQVVLHASAVNVNGRAVLFCGVSGAGKSTMAAALGQRGYAMLTDDACAITTDVKGTPLAQPDGRRLKLWERAIDKLDLGARRGARVRSQIEKFYLDPVASSEEALPVGAVYFLRESLLPRRDGIERPNIADAASLIRKNAYRPRLVQVFGQHALYLRAASDIIAGPGLYILNRPLNFPALPAVVDLLQAHWDSLGLRGAVP